ncbi:MAG TPA: hypothetical protein VFH51_07770, partial [Myxococcota bacterium]|nr:hypothetical protein [Myxococcota bacterium]
MRCSRMCVTLLAVSAIACGKAATTPTADDTESQGAQEALASTEESGNAGSGEAQAPGAALMASPACVDANTTLVAGLSLLDPNAEVRIDLTYNACGIARGVHVSGTTSLDVTLSPSGRTVVLTADVTQTNRTGGTLQVTTDPNIKVASAGVRGPNATVTRTITGADHRVRKNAQGTVVHDMEITHNGTTVADSFDGAGTWSGRTLNGSATVRHNLAKST